MNGPLDNCSTGIFVMFATKVCAKRGAIHIWKRNYVHFLERARSFNDHQTDTHFPFLFVRGPGRSGSYGTHRPYCPYPGYYPPYYYGYHQYEAGCEQVHSPSVEEDGGLDSQSSSAGEVLYVYYV